jgi:hypothetical protein
MSNPETPGNVFALSGTPVSPGAMEAIDIEAVRLFAAAIEAGEVEAYAMVYFLKDSRQTRFCITPLTSVSMLAGGVSLLGHEINQAICEDRL